MCIEQFIILILNNNSWHNHSTTWEDPKLLRKYLIFQRNQPETAASSHLTSKAENTPISALLFTKRPRTQPGPGRRTAISRAAPATRRPRLYPTTKVKVKRTLTIKMGRLRRMVASLISSHARIKLSLAARHSANTWCSSLTTSGSSATRWVSYWDSKASQ